MANHRGGAATPARSCLLQYFYICQITYKVSLNLTKVSILLLYRRLFGGAAQWFRRTCDVLLTYVAAFCVAMVVGTIFQCVPIERAFDKTVDGRCIDNGRFWYANAASTIATDLAVLVLPMPLVYKLQIPRAQKFALALVFALGIL